MAWEQPWTSDTRTHACNCKWRAVVRRGFFATAIAIATAVVFRKQQLKIHWIELFFVWPKKKTTTEMKWKKLWPKRQNSWNPSQRQRQKQQMDAQNTMKNIYITVNGYADRFVKWKQSFSNCWREREREKNLCENEFPLNLNLSHTHTDAHTDTKTRTHVRLAV